LQSLRDDQTDITIARVISELQVKYNLDIFNQSNFPLNKENALDKLRKIEEILEEEIDV
jgi:hypothetical protein